MHSESKTSEGYSGGSSGNMELDSVSRLSAEYTLETVRRFIT